MTLWQATVHQFFDFTRLIGLRDRLRCPKCKAVGTFKPHGGFLDFEDLLKVRRWMCKWCGYYLGPEGVRQVCPNLLKGCWTIRHSAFPDLGDVETPQKVFESNYETVEKMTDMRSNKPYKVWPWKG